LHLILRRFFKIIFQVGTAGIVVLIIMFRKPRIYAEVKWHISRILSLLAAIGIASLLLELTVVTIWWHGRFSLYTGTVGLGTLLVPILTWEVSAAVLTAVFLKLHETNPFRLQARIAQTYSVLKRCAGLLIGVATCALPVAVYLLRDTSFTDRTLLEDLLSYYGMFPWQKLFIFVSFAVLAPLPEELLFRGVIYKSFRARTPTIPAVCLSSLVFAAAHMKLTGSSYTFALGLGSCLLYEYSGSLVPPIIMHMLVSVAFLHSVVW
jgi:membrane protease YdiL (CAAX protease family)